MKIVQSKGVVMKKIVLAIVILALAGCSNNSQSSSNSEIDSSSRSYYISFPMVPPEDISFNLL